MRKGHYRIPPFQPPGLSTLEYIPSDEEWKEARPYGEIDLGPTTPADVKEWAKRQIAEHFNLDPATFDIEEREPGKWFVVE